MQLQQSHSASKVAEHHEVLSQDPDPKREIAQLVGKTNGLPEAAQIFAAGRCGPYVR
jgi:hypothetical protein